MMTKKKHTEEYVHDEEREAASKEYEEKMAEVEKEEPPQEAASHEGQGVYTVPHDVNVAGKDYKAGQQIYLTYEEYQTLRTSGVYCEPVT
jgi:hypothetical protein